MAISYQIKTREDRRASRDGLAPIVFMFRSGTNRMCVSTGMTAGTAFSGVNVPPSETNSRTKTLRLIQLSESVEKCILEHAGEGWAVMKRRLRTLVSGDDDSASMTLLAEYIEAYAKSGVSEGTAELFRLTARKVRSYDAAAVFSTVDSRWLDGFVRHLGRVSVNYSAILLRNIRTVFNRAISDGVTECYPFRRYRIKSEKVPINNITVEQLRELRDYPLDDWRRIYRDLFMLTFYLCGINPVDLLRLRHSDMKNGRITYRRAKTGRLYDIPVPPEAAEIIERYKGHTHLLCPLDRYGNYKDFNKRWNIALKKIGPIDIVPDRVGKMRKHEYSPIVEGMTIYTARYTFASIGALLDIPRETIALCLGHAWTDVTSHYIAYDTRKIDGAVRRIIDFVNGENVNCC